MKRGPRHSFQWLIFTYLLFVLIVSGVLSGSFYFVLFFFGFIPRVLLSPGFAPITTILLLIIVAMMFSTRSVRSRFRPMDELMDAMHRVSQGDFDVRVEEEDLPGQMSDLMHSFNDMAEELGSIELFRKDFINNFSHEFKTPIVSIRGFAKQLERDDLTEEQRREYISIIVSESDRLANMSSNVLLLTKLENQTIVTDKTVYRLDEQLRNCILLLEKQWSEKNIDLDLEMDEADFKGNEEMVAHIWVNLISNAIKFSPDGGVLGIVLKKDGDMLVVRVSDQGEGMDKDTQMRIFEKFYQGDTAHATEGNGLGLSLVKRIVDLCGGEVTVESEPGKGTTFEVRLPQGIEQ